MAYFVHNKYDKASIDALETIGAGQTLVDFYTDYETYKYLDTSAGFGILYDELSYITPGTVINVGQADNDNSHFNFQSSIIIKSIQQGSGSGRNATISISKVDSSKSVFLVMGPNMILQTKNDTSFTVAGNGSYSWQVVEFC